MKYFIPLIVTNIFLLTACLPTESLPTPPTTWYVDADSDGFGDENDAGTASTSQPSGYVSNNTDCDDDRSDVNSDNLEVPYDGLDNDCSGTEFGSNEGQYSIGDIGPAGGIVFYISDGGLGRTGLEAAPKDQDDGNGAEWGCWGIDITGAGSITNGAQNTLDILAAGCESGTPPAFGGNSVAADLVDAYSLNGYDDWYLPAKDELNALYAQKDTVGSFSIDVYDSYWSSSESSAYYPWYQYFNDGRQDDGLNYGNSKDALLRVRAIRAF